MIGLETARAEEKGFVVLEGPAHEAAALTQQADVGVGELHSHAFEERKRLAFRAETFNLILQRGVERDQSTRSHSIAAAAL